MKVFKQAKNKWKIRVQPKYNFGVHWAKVFIELKSEKAKIGEMLVFKLEKQDLVKVFPNVGVQAGWCLRGKPPFPC